MVLWHIHLTKGQHLLCPTMSKAVSVRIPLSVKSLHSVSSCHMWKGYVSRIQIGDPDRAYARQTMCWQIKMKHGETQEQYIYECFMTALLQFQISDDVLFHACESPAFHHLITICQPNAHIPLCSFYPQLLTAMHSQCISQIKCTIPWNQKIALSLDV